MLTASRRTEVFCFVLIEGKVDLILLTCKVAFFLGIKYSKATECHYQSHNYYSNDDATYIKVICNYKRESNVAICNKYHWLAFFPN